MRKQLFNRNPHRPRHRYRLNNFDVYSGLGTVFTPVSGRFSSSRSLECPCSSSGEVVGVPDECRRDLSLNCSPYLPDGTFDPGVRGRCTSRMVLVASSQMRVRRCRRGAHGRMGASMKFRNTCLPGCEPGRHVYVALQLVIAPVGRPEDADCRDAEPSRIQASSLAMKVIEAWKHPEMMR